MDENAFDADDEFSYGQCTWYAVMHDISDDGDGLGAGFGLQDGNGGYDFDYGMNVEVSVTAVDDFILWEVEFALS